MKLKNERELFADILEGAIRYGWSRYFKYREDEPELPLGAFADITVEAMGFLDENVTWDDEEPSR